MKKYLITQNYYLIPFTMDDVDNLTLLDSDPSVMQWLTNGQITSREEITQRVRATIQMLKNYQYKYGMWILRENATDDFVGWFHLRPPKDDPPNFSKLELGYRLLKKFWGRGIATEVGLALIEKAKTELKAKEVFATTMKKNLASRRVMEKCGLIFSHEYYDDRFPIKEEKAVYYHKIF